MPAQLTALTDGPSILVDKPILLVGRHPECDIQIDSRKVSRRHCCIAQVSDYLVVRDLGSTNGVRINGVRVPEGRLNQGDELTIGNHRFQVRLDGLAVMPRPPGAPAQLPDDMLEGCDDPVALPEPEAGRRLPARPALPAAPPKPQVLPDHLELAPASDVFPDSSPSHPHP